jgi:hypothetical protein
MFETAHTATLRSAAQYWRLSQLVLHKHAQQHPAGDMWQLAARQHVYVLGN